MKNLTGILAILMMIFVGLACSSDETTKANETVHEANKFVATANESVVKAGTLYDQYRAKVDSIKNDTGLEEARKMAKDLMPLYESMSENFTKAGAKFEEASKLKIKDKHKEYLDTKAKEMKLRGEYSAELKKIPQALIDSTGEKAYREAVSTISDKVEKMSGEAKTLGEKATQIQKDNPDVMEQPK